MKNISTFLLVFLLALSALAAKKKKAADLEPPPDEVYSVPIQSSQEDLTINRVWFVPRAVDYELSLSNWLPTKMARPSALAQVSDFNTLNVPQISVNRFGGLSEFSNGRVESLVGLSYAQFSRGGALDNGLSTPTGVNEKINLFSLRLGIAYRFTQIFRSYLQPSVEAALVPTWISAGENVIEPNGASVYGVPVEVGAKLIYSPLFMRGMFADSGAGLGLGVHYITGNVGGSDLSGTGIDAIARMSF